MEQVSFYPVETDSLKSVVKLNTAWLVTGKDTGMDYGYLASCVYSRVKANGDVQRITMWGYSLKADEFVTGIIFGYRSRKEALVNLRRDFTRTLPLRLEDGLARIEMAT